MRARFEMQDLGRAKTAARRTEIDRHVVGTGVRDDNVPEGVVVEVANTRSDGDALRIRAEWLDDRDVENKIAIAVIFVEQDRVRSLIRNRNISAAAAEAPSNDEARIRGGEDRADREVRGEVAVEEMHAAGRTDE